MPPMAGIGSTSGWATSMVDTGIVDPLNRVGGEIEPATYDALKRGGRFRRHMLRSRRDANGRVQQFEIGLVAVQPIDPATRLRIGPTVDIDLMRGVAGVPSRVGLVFFHRLTGCRVVWDLGGRTWSIEIP